MPRIHTRSPLTEYKEGGFYIAAQIELLALKMGDPLYQPEAMNIDDSYTVKNDVASFLFTCSCLDDRPDYRADGYRLVSITKHIAPEAGAIIALGYRAEDGPYQEYVATLIEYDDTLGWLAAFSTGSRRIGPDRNFFVTQRP